MTRASLRSLVEDAEDAVLGLRRCYDAHDARGVGSHAKRLASVGASLAARFQGFDDEELAMWVGAVDRAIENGRRQ